MELQIIGSIAGFSVGCLPDAKKDNFIVVKEGATLPTKTDEKFSDFVQKAIDLRLGYVQMENGTEWIYLYDRAGGAFGFGYNVENPDLSEWGYAPFYPGASKTIGEVPTEKKELE